MQRLNYMTLLLKNRYKTISGSDLNNLWECFSNKQNEDLIQNLFLNDLDNFEVTASGLDVDFATIFNTIQSKIKETDDVTFIYNKNDFRQFYFSDITKNEITLNERTVNISQN